MHPDLNHPQAHGALDRLVRRARQRDLDPSPLIEAAGWAADAHAGQRRISGEPYLTHPLEVASLVADLHGSVEMIVAAILHDVVEDTGRSVDDVARRFGVDVARIVDGCTKVSAVHPAADRAAEHAANLRKLFLALADDPRVVVVKVCDRLHNLRTIDVLPPDKARRIGEETLAVHAPLAHRLGLGAVKSELEDRAWAAADRDGYRDLLSVLDIEGLHQRLSAARDELLAHLRTHGLPSEVTGRVKHAWSLRQKSRRHGVDPSDVPDLLGLRVLCDTEHECFAVLAAVHDLWEPDLSRLRDYVNRPKTNGYRSLHTTVATRHGRLEVQVRTRAMHEDAEHGRAAHHAYKHPGDEPAWVARLLEWSDEDLADDEYLEGVRDELRTRREVLVTTPRGDVVELPDGACPVDFAYAIHTEVGERCVGAKVDGRIVALDTRLRDGQRVEILTGQRDGPAAQWLDWVVTSKARSKIRSRLHRDTPQVRPVPGPVAPRSTAAEHRSDVSTRSFTSMRPAVAVLGDLVPRVAGCCRPHAPASIVAMVNKQRLTVHRSDCGGLVDAGDRCLQAYWVAAEQELLTVQVDVVERPGLYAALRAAAGAQADLLALDHDASRAGRVTLLVAAKRGYGPTLRAALRLVDGVLRVR